MYIYVYTRRRTKKKARTKKKYTNRSVYIYKYIHTDMYASCVSHVLCFQ